MDIKKLLIHFGIGVLAFYLIVLFVPGVAIQGDFGTSLKILFFAGIVLGLINHFLKPIIMLITFPLAILTFGLFGLIINMLIIWLVDILFPELIIVGLPPLFWSSLIVWVLNFLFTKLKSHT